MKRTTMHSSKGKKLYAVRNAKGQFKDIQSYKKAHSMDIKHTAKSEKRDKIISYITAFWVTVTEGHTNPVKHNIAWSKMMKKIDALKLFMAFAVLMGISGVAQAGYFRGLDLNHPQTSLGTFSDLKGNSAAGGNLALITHSRADGCLIPGFCIDWVPLAIGGAFDRGLGGASLGLGASANLLPATEALLLTGVKALYPANNKAVALKKLLSPSIGGSPDISIAVGPHYSYVFYDGIKGKGIWTLFSGASWRFDFKGDK